MGESPLKLLFENWRKHLTEQGAGAHVGHTVKAKDVRLGAQPKPAATQAKYTGPQHPWWSKAIDRATGGLVPVERTSPLSDEEDYEAMWDDPNYKRDDGKAIAVKVSKRKSEIDEQDQTMARKPLGPEDEWSKSAGEQIQTAKTTGRPGAVQTQAVVKMPTKKAKSWTFFPKEKLQQYHESDKRKSKLDEQYPKTGPGVGTAVKHKAQNIAQKIAQSRDVAHLKATGETRKTGGMPDAPAPGWGDYDIGGDQQQDVQDAEDARSAELKHEDDMMEQQAKINPITVKVSKRKSEIDEQDALDTVPEAPKLSDAGTSGGDKAPPQGQLKPKPSTGRHAYAYPGAPPAIGKDPGIVLPNEAPVMTFAGAELPLDTERAPKVPLPPGMHPPGSSAKDLGFGYESGPSKLADPIPGWQSVKARRSFKKYGRAQGKKGKIYEGLDKLDEQHLPLGDPGGSPPRYNAADIPPMPWEKSRKKGDPEGPPPAEILVGVDPKAEVEAKPPIVPETCIKKQAIVVKVNKRKSEIDEQDTFRFKPPLTGTGDKAHVPTTKADAVEAAKADAVEAAEDVVGGAANEPRNWGSSAYGEFDHANIPGGAEDVAGRMSRAWAGKDVEPTSPVKTSKATKAFVDADPMGGASVGDRRREAADTATWDAGSGANRAALGPGDGYWHPDLADTPPKPDPMFVGGRKPWAGGVKGSAMDVASNIAHKAGVESSFKKMAGASSEKKPLPDLAGGSRISGDIATSQKPSPLPPGAPRAKAIAPNKRDDSKAIAVKINKRKSKTNEQRSQKTP